MPDKITQVNRDVRSEVQVDVGSLGKLKAGQVGVRTDVVAKNLFDKYPNTDRIAVVQMMAATYCSMIRDSKTLKDSEKLRLWSEFSERVFKFENPSYNPLPAAPKPKRNASPAEGDGGHKGASGTHTSGLGQESHGEQEAARSAASQNVQLQHWFTEDKDFPPGHIEFKAFGLSIPLTLVTGSHFGDDFPLKMAPYYISMAYVPKRFFREHAMSNAVQSAVPPSSEDEQPICEAYVSDTKELAEQLGFQLPTEVQWINAFEGKFIDPHGKVELVYVQDNEKDYLAEVRTDEGYGNTYLSNTVAVHYFLGKAIGCLRIAISVDELKKIGFLKTP